MSWKWVNGLTQKSILFLYDIKKKLLDYYIQIYDVLNMPNSENPSFIIQIKLFSYWKVLINHRSLLIFSLNKYLWIKFLFFENVIFTVVFKYITEVFNILKNGYWKVKCSISSNKERFEIRLLSGKQDIFRSR